MNLSRNYPLFFFEKIFFGYHTNFFPTNKNSFLGTICLCNFEEQKCSIFCSHQKFVFSFLYLKGKKLYFKKIVRELQPQGSTHSINLLPAILERMVTVLYAECDYMKENKRGLVDLIVVFISKSCSPSFFYFYFLF